jgi:putative transposase
MSVKAYKYRIYPNRATAEKLQWTLDYSRELYNAALQERRDAWKVFERSPCYYDPDMRAQAAQPYRISYIDQQNNLPELKELCTEYKEIGAHVLQDVLRRVDKAYQNFFRRVKNGETPGHPRFKGKNQYHSFTYPDHAGWKMEMRTRPPDKKGIIRVNLELSKLGTVKLHLHRNMEGTIKTLTIKREMDQWYAIFTSEVAKPEPLPISYEDVGIDLGVTHLAALSDGTFIEHPRYFRCSEKKLKKAQQALSRKKRGSHRQAKASRQVAKHHRKIYNQRRDFQHKGSRKLVNRYQVIVFEDLQTKNLTKRPKPKKNETTDKYMPNGASAKAGLNKSILDAGWGTFIGMVSVKAESAGRTIIFVNPYKTSQLCSGCSKEVKKDLSERWHSCSCGTELDRDTNAAINILRRGQRHGLGGTRPTLATA